MPAVGEMASLVEAFQAAAAGPPTPAAEVAKVFESLLADGFTAEAIRAEIGRPGRKPEEFPRQLATRLRRQRPSEDQQAKLEKQLEEREKHQRERKARYVPK